MDIQKTYFLTYPVDRVFRAWTSSDTVIAPAQRMHIEPRLGGVYQLFMSADETAPSNSGTFSVFEANQCVVYAWEWYNDGEVTEIAVDFGSEDDGTRINLSHTGFTKPESRDMHDSGWDSYIAGFERLLAAGD